MSSISVDPLFFATAKISTLDDPKSNKVWKFGTGFFYGTEQRIFLITNRHVIIDECKKYLPNVVRLSLHNDPKDLRKNGTYDIPLYDVAEPLWIQQPTPPIADIVAIPFDLQDMKKKGFFIKSFSRANLLPDNIQLEIGEDIMVMGYPLGKYYDSVYNLPIIRSGIIASAYPVPYQGQPHFLIDARLHPGTSGSPVMTKSKNIWRDKQGNTNIGGSQFFLLGVNSSTWQVEGDPLGLNTAVFASIMDSLIP